MWRPYLERRESRVIFNKLCKDAASLLCLSASAERETILTLYIIVSKLDRSDHKTFSSFYTNTVKIYFKEEVESLGYSFYMDICAS